MIRSFRKDEAIGKTQTTDAGANQIKQQSKKAALTKYQRPHLREDLAKPQDTMGLKVSMGVMRTVIQEKQRNLVYRK